MNQKVLAVLFLVIIVLPGCRNNDLIKSANKEESERAVKAEETTVEKSGELVLVDGKITKGMKEWQSFLQKTENTLKQPVEITIKQYYDAGSEATVSVLKYDGKEYTFYYLSDESDVYHYKYLIERSGRLTNAAVGDRIFYLVNDTSVTYAQLAWSVLSSSSYDWIDHVMVFWEICDNAPLVNISRNRTVYPAPYVENENESLIQQDWLK